MLRMILPISISIFQELCDGIVPKVEAFLQLPLRPDCTNLSPETPPSASGGCPEAAAEHAVPARTRSCHGVCRRSGTTRMVPELRNQPGETQLIGANLCGTRKPATT